MHRAPAVRYVVEKSRWYLSAIVGLWLLGFLGLLLLIQSEARFELQTWICLPLLVSAAAAFTTWKKAATGELWWDGQRWHWSGFVIASPCHVILVLDLQTVMLLRLSSATGQHAWICLTSAPKDIQWVALRRAVVASRALHDEQRAHVDKAL